MSIQTISIRNGQGGSGIVVPVPRPQSSENTVIFGANVSAPHVRQEAAPVIEQTVEVIAEPEVVVEPEPPAIEESAVQSTEEPAMEEPIVEEPMLGDPKPRRIRRSKQSATQEPEENA